MSEFKVHATNVAGIDELELELEGETVLISGQNASNKTSLLKSIAFGMGSPHIPIRSGADEARVELTLDGRTVERVAKRTPNGVQSTGDGLVADKNDALLIERFATLLETNALRTAVATDSDIEALLKEPMDINALERQQAELLQERHDLEADLEALGDIDDELAKREAELNEKHQRIKELEDRLDELYDEQKAINTDDEELQSFRDQRADLRAEKDRLESQREEIRDALSRLEDDLKDITQQLHEAKEANEEYNVKSLKAEREEVQAELQDVTERLEILQSVLTANREMLNSNATGIFGYESGIMGDEVTCWACGRDASRESFDETIAELAELVQTDKQRKREHEPEIEELTEHIEEARSAKRRVDDLKGRKQELEQKLESRRESLERKTEQLDELQQDLEEINAKIADHEGTQGSEQSEIAAEIEELRVEIQTFRRDTDRLEDVCANLREKQAERDRKEERVEALTQEIRELTERIENLESELRKTFNEAMDDLIDYLEFNRIDRVWLDGNFDLVIAREVDGTIRQDSLAHLAESEREMIGLVLGLAGFIAYDVREVTPVLLLDSLGAFDTERTERLIEYFSDRTDVLLAALHPEMAAEFNFETVTFETPVTP
jgi:predicted  nucleic acid-binding Zn-ribbon protein